MAQGSTGQGGVDLRFLQQREPTVPQSVRLWSAAMTGFMPAVTAAICMAGMWKLMNKAPRQQCTRCEMYMNRHAKSCPFYQED